MALEDELPEYIEDSLDEAEFVIAEEEIRERFKDDPVELDKQLGALRSLKARRRMNEEDNPDEIGVRSPLKNPPAGRSGGIPLDVPPEDEEL